MAWTQSYHARIMLQLFVGFTWLITLSFPAQAASEQRCRQYAQSAVADYRQLRNIPKCSKLRKEDTVRWHPDFNTHYNWCLQAKTEWLTAETAKRDELLLSVAGGRNCSFVLECHNRVRSSRETIG
jgi:hypothetical protein